jgi:hypothetical protein
MKLYDSDEIALMMKQAQGLSITNQESLETAYNFTDMVAALQKDAERYAESAKIARALVTKKIERYKSTATVKPKPTTSEWDEI